MYRVLLKIDKVSIRIKEVVDLHIIIKKRNDFFTHCKHQKLINGILILHNTSQFFITMQQPSFEIEIYLLASSIRKKGGVVVVNLSQYSINTSHRITTVIQNSPLHNSTLLIDFAYMLSEDITTTTNSLLSLHQLQQGKHKKYLNDLSRQNASLILHNELLSKQIVNLKDKNEALVSEGKEMEEENEQKERDFEIEMGKIEEEKQYNYETLLEEKKRLAEIVDIINGTGDAGLIQEMGDIISKKASDIQNQV